MLVDAGMSFCGTCVLYAKAHSFVALLTQYFAPGPSESSFLKKRPTPYELIRMWGVLQGAVKLRERREVYSGLALPVHQTVGAMRAGTRVWKPRPGLSDNPSIPS